MSQSAEKDVPAYLDLPSLNPLICRRCGVLVDRAFLAEHDSHHNRVIPPSDIPPGFVDGDARLDEIEADLTRPIPPASPAP